MVQERDKKKSFCVFSRCLRLKNNRIHRIRKKQFVFFVLSVDNKKIYSLLKHKLIINL